MEKTITVDKLIKNYLELTSDIAKEKYLNTNVKIVDYIEVPVIDVIATSVVNASSFDQDGKLHIDTFKKYILGIISIIDNCTSIEFDNNRAIEQYDNLRKTGLLEIIKNAIPDEVASDIQTVIDLKSTDLLTNYNLKIYNEIKDIPNYFIDIINNIGDVIINNLSEIDFENINKIISESKDEKE